MYNLTYEISLVRATFCRGKIETDQNVQKQAICQPIIQKYTRFHTETFTSNTLTL